MLKVFAIFVVALIINLSDGKIFEKCELAREMIETYGTTFEDAEKFICMAEYPSGYNTEYNEENSLGIFNISKNVCETETIGGSCYQTCESLMDDHIENDLECAKQAAVPDPYCELNAVNYLHDCSLTGLKDEDQNEQEDDEIYSSSTEKTESLGEIYSTSTKTPEESPEVYSDTEENKELEKSPQVYSDPEETKKAAEINQQQEPPGNLDDYDIDEISGPNNFNLEQIKLIRQLVRQNPRQKVKYIFVFV